MGNKPRCSDEFDCVIDCLNEAIKLQTVDSLKAKYYFRIAQFCSEMNKKSLAKTYALKAISLKENYGSPNILIATFYAGSGCSQLSSPEGQLDRVGYLGSC
jgi:hypothetical protein